jgi:hypothetical protein
MSVFLLSYHSVPELSAVRSSVHCYFSGLHPLHYTLRPPVNSKLKLKTQNSNSKLKLKTPSNENDKSLVHSTDTLHNSTSLVHSTHHHSRLAYSPYLRHFSEPLTLFRRLHQFQSQCRCLYVSFAPLNHRPSHATPHRTPPSSTAHHTHSSLIADRPNASLHTSHYHSTPGAGILTIPNPSNLVSPLTLNTAHASRLHAASHSTGSTAHPLHSCASLV